MGIGLFSSKNTPLLIGVSYGIMVSFFALVGGGEFSFVERIIGWGVLVIPAFFVVCRRKWAFYVICGMIFFQILRSAFTVVIYFVPGSNVKIYGETLSSGFLGVYVFGVLICWGVIFIALCRKKTRSLFS